MTMIGNLLHQLMETDKVPGHRQGQEGAGRDD